MECECQLRPWRLSDAANLAAAIGSKKVQDNLRDGIPFPYTEDDARAFIREMLDADPDAVYAYAITVEDRAIGSIGVYRQGNIHRRTAELGYYLAEPFWGKGLATSAVSAVCRRIFDSTDILRIYAEPFAYNTASCRVLEKCGFVCEGTLRCNAEKNGRILDMKMYARIRD